MSKISVSVPDELLARARAVDGTANTSQLVQRALEQLTAQLAEHDHPDHQRPADVDGLLALARDKLLTAARAEFQHGYRAGLEDAGSIDWAVMEDIASAQFDLFVKLTRWKQAYAPTRDDPGFKPPAWFSMLMKRFGSMIDPIGFDGTNFTPTRKFVRGYAAALQDAWAAVMDAEQGNEPSGRGN
jgi:hypothetical protein